MQAFLQVSGSMLSFNCNSVSLEYLKRNLDAFVILPVKSAPFESAGEALVSVCFVVFRFIVYRHQRLHAFELDYADRVDVVIIVTLGADIGNISLERRLVVDDILEAGVCEERS